MRVWWTSFLEKETTHFSPLEIEHFCSSLAAARPSFVLQCWETWTKCNTHTQVDLVVLTQALTQFSVQQIKGMKGKRQKRSHKRKQIWHLFQKISTSFYKPQPPLKREQCLWDMKPQHPWEDRVLKIQTLINHVIFIKNKKNCDVLLTLKKK